MVPIINYMPFLVKKILKGRPYYYLRHNHYVDGKSKTAWQIYLGSEESLQIRGKLAKLEFSTETIEFGLLAALLHIADKLKIIDVINQYTNKRSQGLSVGHHVLFAALNRCVQPTSKRQLKRWFKKTMLEDQHSEIDSALDSRAYWAHFKYLSDSAIEDVENDFIKTVQSKFNVNIDDISFDPTNFYTYIRPRNEDTQKLAKHGHSKEGRKSLNIVNMSLFSTLDTGVPLFHLLYPGNVQDARHFRELGIPAIKRRLQALDIDTKKITLVFDKGNLSDEGFKQLETSGFDYICSDRPSTHKDLLGLAPDSFHMNTLPNGKEVGVKEFYFEKYGKKRRFIATYNPAQARWNKINLEAKVQKKVDGVEEYFKDRVVFKPGEKRRGQADKWRKREEVEKKIKAIIGGAPYKNIISFSVKGPKSLPIAKGGRFQIDVSIHAEKMAQQEMRLGKAFLMTSREDITPHDVVWSFRQQYLVERAFKWLKNTEFLSIRPMFHRVDDSIRGHVFVCYIGLLLLSLLVRELGQAGVPTSIFKAIEHLKDIRLTRISISGKEKPLITLDKMSAESKEIYEALNLKRYL